MPLVCRLPTVIFVFVMVIINATCITQYLMDLMVHPIKWNQWVCLYVDWAVWCLNTIFPIICAWVCCGLISFSYTTSNSGCMWFIYQYSPRLLYQLWVNIIEVTLNDMGKSVGTLQQQNTIKCEPLEGTAEYIIRILHIDHTLDPFYQYGLTETEACINRPIHYNMWNVIIYPRSNFNACMSD